MSPADPRHGSKAGYQAGCRDQCCRHAQMVHMKLYRLGRRNRRVPILGTIRRVQALKAIGYTDAQIGALIERPANWSSNLARYDRLYESTAREFAEAYDRISMTVPDGIAATRARMNAARKGYAPPLAWDDIDDPEATADTGKRAHRVTADIIEEYKFLKAVGESEHSIARQLDMDYPSLLKALNRHAATQREAA